MKTQEFKVGDIVRFKNTRNHLDYANQWKLPRSGLKIKTINRDIVFFEGQQFCSLASRLEKQPSLFTFGKKNPKIKKLFLDYIKGHRSSGLCWYTEDKSDEAYEFLKLQKVFEVNPEAPVEYFVLRSKKKSTKNAWNNYVSAGCSYNSPSTPEGRLRIWWATNLAIAASQGKI